MQLHGSCHCGAVSFRLESPHPYPFNVCYCSICRKTAGGGGYAINLGGHFDTLQVEGRDKVAGYRARIENSTGGGVEVSPCERRFCQICGSALWIWDPRWPDLVHPFALAIDNELPVPPERTHLMLGSKASWIRLQSSASDKHFDDYPQESIEAWHKRLHLEC